MVFLVVPVPQLCSMRPYADEFPMKLAAETRRRGARHSKSLRRPYENLNADIRYAAHCRRSGVCPIPLPNYRGLNLSRSLVPCYTSVGMVADQIVWRLSRLRQLFRSMGRSVTSVLLISLAAGSQAGNECS